MILLATMREYERTASGGTFLRAPSYASRSRQYAGESSQYVAIRSGIPTVVEMPAKPGKRVPGPIFGTKAVAAELPASRNGVYGTVPSIWPASRCGHVLGPRPCHTVAEASAVTVPCVGTGPSMSCAKSCPSPDLPAFYGPTGE